MTADPPARDRKTGRARVPEARVVFDRFHVERLAADAVDEVRRAEQHPLGCAGAKDAQGGCAMRC